MPRISDITDTEKWVMQPTPGDRHGRELEPRLADADTRPHPSDRELTRFPVIFRRDDAGVGFKTGDHNDRRQLSREPCTQTGSGVSEHEDLTARVVSVLQAQADSVAGQRGDLVGKAR